MAKFGRGFGEFIGKVGNVVGYYRNGVFCIRSAPKKKKKKAVPPPAQLAQQARFRLVSRTLLPLNELLKFTFYDPHKPGSGYNRAVSHALKNSVKGIYPNFEIDWEELLVCKGSLLTRGVMQSVLKSDQIIFSWSRILVDVNRDDISILIVYDPELQNVTFSKGPVRDKGKGSIDVSNFKGQTVHTYLAFVTQDGKQKCDSVYAGKVEVI